MVGIIRFIIYVNKMKKKMGGKIKMGKAVLHAAFAEAISGLLILCCAGVILFGMVFAVADMFSALFSFGDDPYEVSKNLTDEQVKELEKLGAFIDPRKLYTYMDKEKESVPSSITGVKTVTTGVVGGESSSNTSNVNLDVTSITSPYKMPWQYLATIDIVSGNALDRKNSQIVDSSSIIMPKFSWESGYSRDETDYWKEWKVVTEEDTVLDSNNVPKLDPNKVTVKSDGESKAPENYTEVKTPIPMLSSVDTMFGTYKYNILKDIVVQDDDYCERYVVEKKEISKRMVIDHYENGEKIYKDVKKWVDDETRPIMQNVPIYEKYDTFEYKKYFWTSTDIEIKTSLNPDIIDTSTTYTYNREEDSYYVFENNGVEVFIPKYIFASEPPKKSTVRYSGTNQKVVGYDKVWTGKYEQKQITVKEWTGEYVQVPIERPIYTYETTYKKTKKKIVEDRLGSSSTKFDPTNFISYLNKNKLRVSDLELIKMSLMTMPDSSDLVDKIQSIIDGNYGNINDSANGGGGYMTVPNDELINKLIEYAKKYLGYPYESPGKAPESFDCSSFTQWVYKSVEINLPRTSQQQSTFETENKVIYDLASKKGSLSDIYGGDLLIFYSGGTASHVGLAISNSEYIHASTPETGVIISKIPTETSGDYYVEKVRRFDKLQKQISIGMGASDIPVFYQHDSRWGSKPYAGENIALAGCCPTTMAMIVSGMGGNLSGIDTNNDGVVDPEESANWSTANGYAAYMQGSYDTLVTAMATKTGLTAIRTSNGNEAYEALKEGKCVVLNVAAGTIINGDHFLALIGVDGDGKVLMNDPARATNTFIDGDESKGRRGWDLDVIKRDAKNYWIIDNPNITPTQKHIGKLKAGAFDTYRKYGIFPSVTIGQAILEAGWPWSWKNGYSELASKYNNLFGIKASSGWTGPTVDLWTTEDAGTPTFATWRVYSSWAESIEDHGKFIEENRRYGEAGFFKAKDYKGQAQVLEDAGYATAKDPITGEKIYADLIIKVIEDNSLQLFDKGLSSRD